MKKLRFIKLVLGIILIGSILAACKKDKSTVPLVNPIVGKWTGKFDNMSDFGFNIKSGGLLEYEDPDGNVIAKGTWELTGNNFKGTYISISGIIIVSVNATFNGANKLTDGTYVDPADSSYKGVWYLNKQ